MLAESKHARIGSMPSQNAHYSRQE